MRPFILAENDDKRTFWRNHREVGMRHAIAFTAGHADFVWLERIRVIELANGLYDHDKSVTAAARFDKSWNCLDYGFIYRAIKTARIGLICRNFKHFSLMHATRFTPLLGSRQEKKICHRFELFGHLQVKHHECC